MDFKKAKSLINNLSANGNFSWELSEIDVASLMAILDFCSRTAKFCMEQEAFKGSDEGEKKMKGYYAESEFLLKKLYTALELGEKPKETELH
jgi:hypothetical protein